MSELKQFDKVRVLEDGGRWSNAIGTVVRERDGLYEIRFTGNLPSGWFAETEIEAVGSRSVSAS